ncbi:methyltransferase domain-containing protein [Methylomonas sp. SURF-1]|uniref:Methyltransferase domain-containing protein n=1 Tax=Methylomonas aurea TaxID=2952224 RepID=A0ABT1UC69_9GAMM|nr:methyltransferase domain-containing protein [Methylomonas sp. SURF-1]MCQ8179827.1 methyltransferase domain-containing protein [Methylomonas sp. SURF-1]
MSELDMARTRAAAAYNAAADHFDHPVNGFWDRFGRATVAGLNLQPGMRVLDVCSGTGASALPAAERVGADGYVLGIDLAENLLVLARQKAAAAGLGNVEFRHGDMLTLGLPDAGFDAVVCVFGIFFVPDMAVAVRELWRMVRPGGQLAITTWGPDFFEPANSAFWQTIRHEAPHLHKAFNPWDRISDPTSLRAMLREAGIVNVDIVEDSARHPLASPEDWWTTLIGSGYRGTIDQLDAAAFDRVKQANLNFIEQNGISAVQANVIYALADKPV